MSLKGEYNEAILTELLLEKLKTGSIPTLEAITEEFETLQAAEPLLGTKPLFSLKDNSVEFYENASASKTNDSFERYAKDVRILWETITKIKGDIIRNSRRWSTSYATTKRYLETLEDRMENLLLLNSDTLGYFQYVSDDLTTTDFVDLDQTTVAIDTATGLATITEETTETGEQARIDTSAVTESDMSFSVVSATGFLSTVLATDSALANCLTDEYKTWLSYVTTSAQAPVTAALKIDLKETKTVNKIVFKVNGSTATSAFSITAMYSSDGVDFLVVPTDGNTQSTLDSATFVFADTDMRYLKFLITKNGADDKDDDSYTFEFGAKSIALYESGYSVTTGQTFVSTVRSVLDTDGNLVQFQKATLSICEQIPDGTDIQYSIGIDNGSTFIAIDPIERENPSKPQILDFSELVALDNTDSTNVFDTLLDSDVLVQDTLVTFAKVNEADEVLNWYMPSTDVDTLDETTVVVYRNVGDKTNVTEQVRGIARGWLYDATANTYTTVIYISDPDGLVVDFGTTLITIDDVSVTGAVTLSQGNHNITTSGDNWLLVESGLTSLTDLKAADTLYPYNHKLLIEGYDYGSTYTDELVYTGASFFAERIMTYTSTHEFNTQTDSADLSAYTRDLDTDSNTVFVFKVDRSFSDQFNERFLVEYKLANKTFTDVVFKAVFSTTDPSLTPILDAYVIKLG